MAVRMLLVLAVVAIFYGCGQSGSSPEQSQEKRAGELESAVPVGPERLKSTKPVSVGQQLLSGVRDVGLYAMDPTGSNSTRLTDGVDPDWSPDGEQIAYTRYLKEPNPYASSAPSSVDADPYTETPAIFAMNADGSGGEQLLNKAAVEPAWSPDGKKIAFALYTPEKRYKDIGYGYCVINADGSGTPRKLAAGPGCASHPTWSPDGKKIAYTNGLGADKMAREKSEIYVCYAPGGKGCMNQPRALTHSAPGRAYYPEWSPDGSEIAFTFADTVLDTLKGGIYKMNADGSDETPLALTEDMSANESVEIFDEKATPAWSPDGDRIAYVRAVNDQGTLYFREIHIMNSDGSDPMIVKDFGSGRDVVGLDWKPLAPKNHGVTVHPPDTGGPSLLLVASALLFSAGVLFYTAVRT